MRLPLATTLAAVALLTSWLSPQATGASKKKATTARKPATTKSKTAVKGFSHTPPNPAAQARLRDQIDQVLEEARSWPIENVAALVPFYEQLYRHEGGQEGGVHILHYGDSHTAADEWTGFLRALFQTRFGDGGSGYTYAGRPWNSFRRMDLRSSDTGGWYSDGLVGRGGDGLYGMGGVSITTSRPKESVSLEVNCESLELLYLKQPGGGTLALEQDGVRVATIDTNGETGPGYFQINTVAGVHRFNLETLDRAPVRLLGWVAEQGRGVTYETLGINGAQASIVFGWNENLTAEHIGRRNPALIVLAYGTNEAGNAEWTRESYRDMFAALIHRFRKAAPAASILVVGPPDRMIRLGRRGGWQIYNNVDRIVEAQREAALATGCSFIDLRAKMGGKGSIGKWVRAGLAQSDYVHFTATGYRLLGGALFQDLMGHYGTFRRVRDQVIGQAEPRPPTAAVEN